MIRYALCRESASTAIAERQPVLLRCDEPLDYETSEQQKLPISDSYGNSSQELNNRRCSFYFDKNPIKDTTELKNCKVTKEIQRDKQEKNWYSKAFKQLKTFRELSKNWNSYGAESPNNTAIHWAQKVINVLNKFDFPPTGIAPSAEGGIGIYFSKGKLYADLECFNTGEILAVISDSKTEPTVWEIYDGEMREGKEGMVIEAVRRIREFISK